MATPYRVLIADDYAPFREVLKDLLQKTEDLQVVGEACDGCELIGFFEILNPHLVILDISMPKLNGIEAARQLKRLAPQLSILILTSHEDIEYLREAISVGVSGYLLKGDQLTDLFPAIHAIRQGGTYFSRRIYEKMSGSGDK